MRMYTADVPEVQIFHHGMKPTALSATQRWREIVE